MCMKALACFAKCIPSPNQILLRLLAFSYYSIPSSSSPKRHLQVENLLLCVEGSVLSAAPPKEQVENPFCWFDWIVLFILVVLLSTM